MFNENFDRRITGLNYYFCSDVVLNKKPYYLDWNQCGFAVTGYYNGKRWQTNPMKFSEL